MPATAKTKERVAELLAHILAVFHNAGMEGAAKLLHELELELDVKHNTAHYDDVRQGRI